MASGLLSPPEPQIDPPTVAASSGDAALLKQLLARLRTRIRRYVVVQGTAHVLISLGLLFWLLLGIDWFFEPPVWVRGLLGVLALAASGTVLFRNLLRPACRPLPDRSMAVLIERRYPQFADSLVTSVEMEQTSAESAELYTHLLERTRAKAASHVDEVDLDRILDYQPLVHHMAMALVLTVSVAAFALAAPETWATWARRSLAFSEELYPRRTRLTVEGFENGRLKVPRGSDVPIRVQADMSMVVPSVVELRYRTPEGGSRREAMSREGEADPEKDAYQNYAYTFTSVPSHRLFDVIGGDAIIRDLVLEVVDSPTLTQMTLLCEFPEYTELLSREIPVTGLMQVPEGTQITILATANKPLQWVRIDHPQSTPAEPGTDSLGEPLAEINFGNEPQQEFRYELGPLMEDQTLLFALQDTDNILSREPVRLTLTATADRVPQLSVRPTGIGRAITPRARLPFQGDIQDDYALTRGWFEYTIDTAEPQELSLATRIAGRAKAPIDEVFEVAALELTPGQRLQIAVKAEDNDTQEPVVHGVGASERFTLDIVTPEQLRALLESQELNLRRRFEQILSEVTDTRDSLVGLDLSGLTADSSTQATTDAEPPDADPESTTAEQRQSVIQLRLQRALQNSRKSASETSGVASGFDDIRLELINNRVDSEELLLRLENGISVPLHRVAEEMFPAWERELAALNEAFLAGQVRNELLVNAVMQGDEVVLEMERILEQMLELETFNELLELLRTVINSQDELNEQTEQQRKQDLRDLLED